MQAPGRGASGAWLDTPLVQWGAWIPAIVWMVFIYQTSARSTLPRAYQTVLSVVGDKAAHVAAYMVLAIAYMVALYPRWRAISAYRRAIIASALAMVYAASDEWHQTFVVGRTGEVSDWLADTAGAILGAGAAARVELQRRSD